MLILPQRVTVTWNGGNRKHFEYLGYKYTKRGEPIEVDVQELSEGSNYEVQVICDYCQNNFLYPFSKYVRASRNRIQKVACQKSDCKAQLKKEVAETLRTPFEEIKKVYEDNDCVLLETEYKGYTALMRFRCSCGNEDVKTFERFKLRNACCRDCANERRIKQTRLSFNEVYDYFEEQGCHLLEIEYLNNSTPLRYICNCGNEATVSLSNFKIGNRCEACAGQRRAEAKRHDFSYVQEVFEEYGCHLLETEYVDGHTPMLYVCVCGREDMKSLFKFLAGQRCRQCYLDNNRGENNPAWNPDKTDEEREYGRIIEGYKQWKKDCLKRDNFICKVCNKRGGDLHVHHIFSYSDFKLLRVELLNGITLCVDCHKGKEGFHGIYGNKNTSPEEFLEFLKRKDCLDRFSEIEIRIKTLYEYLVNG
jgi:hypothetical protein